MRLVSTAAALAVLFPATAFAGADLTFDSISATYNPINPAVELTLRVKNTGNVAVQAAYYVEAIAIQDGDWLACGPEFWEFERVTDDLAPGAVQEIEMSFHPDHLRTGEMYIYVDLPGDIAEDDEGNNSGLALVVNDGMIELFEPDFAFDNKVCVEELIEDVLGVLIPDVEDRILAVLPVFPYP